MATVKVIHKTRAYIGGITYDPGQEAEIDEKDFNESTHEKAADRDKRVEAEKRGEKQSPPWVQGTEANQNTPMQTGSAVPPRNSNFVTDPTSGTPQSSPVEPTQLAKPNKPLDDASYTYDTDHKETKAEKKERLQDEKDNR